MGIFIGFVFLCTLGTPECTHANAIQAIQIPGTFSSPTSDGFAVVACQKAAVAYARVNYDPKINRIGVGCEYQASK